MGADADSRLEHELPRNDGSEPRPEGSAVAATRTQIRGSSILMSGRLITLVANMAIQVIIVRTLSVEDYGVFAYALAFTTTARIVVTLGHNRTITRFLTIYEERREYDKLFGTLVMEVGIIIAMGLSIVGGVWALRGWLTGVVLDQPHAVTVLVLILLLAPLEALDDLAEGMFAVFAKARSIFVRKYLLAPALRLSVVLALVLAGQGAVFLAAGYVLVTALGVVYYGFVLARVMRQRGLLQHWNRRRLSLPFREVFGFSIPLLSTDLVVISMNTVSTMLLGFYGGAAAVAGYRAIRPAAVLNQFIMRSFSLLFLPLASRLYARNDPEGMRDAYWQTAVWLAVFTFPVFAMTVPFAEPLVVALFGDRYRNSAPYLALLSFGYYFNVSLGFNALILQVFGRLKYLVGVNVGAAVANIALSLLLIPRFGALGVASANCVTLLLQNVLNQAGLGRGIGVGMFMRSYLRIYVSILVAAVILGVVAFAYRPEIVVSVLLSGLASVLVFLVNRNALRLGDTFPELLRIPIVRRIVDGGTAAGAPGTKGESARPPASDDRSVSPRGDE